ncbi:MAG: hypothetical protein P8182_03630 [Deltaproteobacteria bacterium]
MLAGALNRLPVARSLPPSGLIAPVAPVQQLGKAERFVFFATGLTVDPVADAGLAHKAGRAVWD